jgi:hypothetical protein
LFYSSRKIIKFTFDSLAFGVGFALLFCHCPVVAVTSLSGISSQSLMVDRGRRYLWTFAWLLYAFSTNFSPVNFELPPI